MKYLCTSCGVIYGSAPTSNKKPKFNFCPGCWELHLAQQKKNIRMAFVKSCEEKAIPPVWEMFEIDKNRRINDED